MVVMCYHRQDEVFYDAEEKHNVKQHTQPYVSIIKYPEELNPSCVQELLDLILNDFIKSEGHTIRVKVDRKDDSGYYLSFDNLRDNRMNMGKMMHKWKAFVLSCPGSDRTYEIRGLRILVSLSEKPCVVSNSVDSSSSRTAPPPPPSVPCGPTATVIEDNARTSDGLPSYSDAVKNSSGKKKSDAESSQDNRLYADDKTIKIFKNDPVFKDQLAQCKPSPSFVAKFEEGALVYHEIRHPRPVVIADVLDWFNQGFFHLCMVKCDRIVPDPNLNVRDCSIHYDDVAHAYVMDYPKGSPQDRESVKEKIRSLIPVLIPFTAHVDGNSAFLLVSEVKELEPGSYNLTYGPSGWLLSGADQLLTNRIKTRLVAVECNVFVSFDVMF